MNALINTADIAWSIITDYLAELLESKVSKICASSSFLHVPICSCSYAAFKSQDVMDELADIREKKRKATLEQRRSFFVRMVSDPAIQPGFTKTPNRTGAKLDTQATIGGIGSNPHTAT